MALPPGEYFSTGQGDEDEGSSPQGEVNRTISGCRPEMSGKIERSADALRIKSNHHYLTTFPS